MPDETTAIYTDSFVALEATEPRSLLDYIRDLITYLSSRPGGTDKELTRPFHYRYEDCTEAPLVRGKDIDSVQEAVSQVLVRENNRRAIKLLEEWFAEPDDLGEDFWKEFDEELDANRFRIS